MQQPGGQQFFPAGATPGAGVGGPFGAPFQAPEGQPQAYAQSYAQPYAQSYAQSYADPYAQAQAQFYGQPQAQSYGQPQPQFYGQPQAQSYGQPPPQAYTQQQPQPYSQPASQAAPVAGVACPTVAPPSGHTSQSQQSPQAAFASHLKGIARSLEQIIPGYQIMLSVMQGLTSSPQVQAPAAVEPLLDRVKDVTYAHFATLGTIRRFLCGEATPDVLAGLAIGVQQVAALHAQLKPLVERVLMSATPELRMILSGLGQMVTGAETNLTQAVTAVQQAVGPQIWEAARARMTTVAVGAGAAAAE